MTNRNVIFIGQGGTGDSLCEQLRACGWDVHVAKDFSAAKRLVVEHRFVVGLICLCEFNASASAEADSFLRAHHNIEWVGCFKPEALRLSCWRELILERLFDHLTVPVEAQRISAVLGHAWGHAELRHASLIDAGKRGMLPIVGQSPEVVRLLRQVRQIARVDAPALICGESGSGKELVAKAIHDASRRSNGSFVIVNCGAIPAALIQSELFGHEKGSFTGADRQTRGLIEAASGGTVFLDEIGDLPLAMQTNLLRFLQESTIDRVGSAKGIRVDVRVIAATNVDLESAVQCGTFRKDLFYRLNVLPISVPPLRERLADIDLLAQHFYEKFASDRSANLKGFSRCAMTVLRAHDWPGNVRELINRIRRAVVLAEGKLITPTDLGLKAVDQTPDRAPLDEARRSAERDAIAESLQFAGKNVSNAAKQLRISRMTMYRLMAKHRIHA